MDAQSSTGTASTIESDTFSIYHATLSVPTSAIGLLIGKSGSTLKMIMTRSGAVVRLQNSNDMLPGTKERAMSISGQKNQVQEALKIVLLKLQSHAPSSSPQFHTADNNALCAPSSEVEIEDPTNELVIIQWAIPQSATGMLIGKQGMRIKYINDMSGAWVKIAHPEETSLGTDERRVYIRGTKTQAETALKIVRDLAGGRPLTDVIEEDRTDIFIPRRAQSAVMEPNTSAQFNQEKNENTIFIENSMKAEGHNIRIEVDTTDQMGLSQILVCVYGPQESRSEAARRVKQSVNDWLEKYSSPVLTPRTPRDSLTPRAELSQEEIEQDAERLAIEMCVILLLCDTPAIFPPSMTSGGTRDVSLNVQLKSVETRYPGVILNFGKSKAVSKGHAQSCRAVSLTGSLRTLLSAFTTLIRSAYQASSRDISPFALFEEKARPSTDHARQVHQGSNKHATQGYARTLSPYVPPGLAHTMETSDSSIDFSYNSASSTVFNGVVGADNTQNQWSFPGMAPVKPLQPFHYQGSNTPYYHGVPQKSAPMPILGANRGYAPTLYVTNKPVHPQTGTSPKYAQSLQGTVISNRAFNDPNVLLTSHRNMDNDDRRNMMHIQQAGRGVGNMKVAHAKHTHLAPAQSSAEVAQHSSYAIDSSGYGYIVDNTIRADPMYGIYYGTVTTNSLPLYSQDNRSSEVYTSAQLSPSQLHLPREGHVLVSTDVERTYGMQMYTAQSAQPNHVPAQQYLLSQQQQFLLQQQQQRLNK